MDCPQSRETLLPCLEDASLLSHRGVHVQLRILVAASILEHLEDSQEHQVVRLNQAGGDAFHGSLIGSAAHVVECEHASANRGFEGSSSQVEFLNRSWGLIG